MMTPGHTQLTDMGGPDRDADNARFEHMFDPWLACSHGLFEQISGSIILDFECVGPPRQRCLREADRQNRDAIITAVVANLAFTVATGIETPAVGIGLRAGKQKKTRYDRDGLTALPRVLGALAERLAPDVLTLSISKQWGRASAIIPGPDLLRALHQSELTADHFHQLPGRECIWLSRTERDFAGNVVGRELIDYADTPKTIRYRAEMQRLNDTLAAADIRLDAGNAPTTPTRLRTLRRAFNLPTDAPEGTERFDLGGRLFGGWWQTLPSTRRHAIRIDGEPIADLDFASMFLRLAYAKVGVRSPDGDLYAGITGLSEPRWRQGVKKVVSAMLFRAAPLVRLPRGTRDLLPPGLSATHLRSAIISAHPALSEVFETGIGLGIMFQESQVLVAALLALADEGVVALPMHDGLMVAQSKADLAARAMGDAAEAITGCRLPISLNDHRYHHSRHVRARRAARLLPSP